MQLMSMQFINYRKLPKLAFLSSLFILSALVLSGCARDIDPVPTGVKQRDRGEYMVDRNFPNKMDGKASALVMHYTAIDDEKSLQVLTGGKVSIHYLVKSKPEKERGKPVAIYLTPEDQEAWHAGVSYWRGKSSLNKSSVGIEIVNPGYTENPDGTRKWYKYNQEQIDLIIPLAKDIIKRNNIQPYNIVAHSDIAPQRKSDPGPYFPWQYLASKGVGAWPDTATVAKFLAGRKPNTPTDVATFQRLLAQYGYEVPRTGTLDKETKNVVTAFQMHFRPAKFDGIPDAESEAILKALITKYRM